MHGGHLKCVRTALSTLWRKGALGIAPPAAQLRRMPQGSARSLGQAGARHLMRSARRRRSHACVLCLDNHVACHHSPSAACAARTSRSAASAATMVPARRVPSDRLRRHAPPLIALRHLVAQRPSPRRNRCRRVGAAKRRGVRRGRAERSAASLRRLHRRFTSRTTCSGQRGAHSRQQTACGRRHAVSDMRHAADGTRADRSTARRATCSLWHARSHSECAEHAVAHASATARRRRCVRSAHAAVASSAPHRSAAQSVERIGQHTAATAHVPAVCCRATAPPTSTAGHARTPSLRRLLSNRSFQRAPSSCPPCWFAASVVCLFVRCVGGLFVCSLRRWFVCLFAASVVCLFAYCVGGLFVCPLRRWFVCLSAASVVCLFVGCAADIR
jgi:hypothetical protein